MLPWHRNVLLPPPREAGAGFPWQWLVVSQQRTVTALQGSPAQEQLRLLSPPRQGHATAGQVSATAQTVPVSSCSSVNVTRRAAAASFFLCTKPVVSCTRSHDAPCPDACAGRAPALPRMLFPERGPRFPATSLLGQANIARPRHSSRSRSGSSQGYFCLLLTGWRCEILRVRKSSQQGHNLDSLCNTNRLPNRRHEMEEWLHLYNSTLKISLFCT